MEAISPFRLRRYDAQLPGGTESEAVVILRRAEQDGQRHVRGISSGKQRVHQCDTDAYTLVIREDADRPHGDNPVGRNGRVARRNVADHPAVE